MSSIPLPALSIHAPEQPDLMHSIGQVMSLKSMMQGQALQQQQLANEKQTGQSGAIDLQMKQKALEDEKTVQQVLSAHGGNLETALPELAGKVSPKTFMGLDKYNIDKKKDLAEIDSKELATKQDVNTRMLQLIDTASKLPPDQYAAQYPQIAAAAKQLKPDLKIDPAQMIPQQMLPQFGLGLQTEAQYIAQEKAKRDAKEFADKEPGMVADSGLKQKELENFGKPTDKDRYVQNQENYRAALGRQASMSNELQKQGIASLQKQGDTYQQFLGTANSLKNSLLAAKDGNQLAAAVAPLQGTLFITTSEGVKRINETELKGVARAGSLVQRIEGSLGKLKGDGPLSDDLKDDMSKLVDLYTASKYSAYKNNAAYTQKLHGMDSTKTPILSQDGTIAGASQPMTITLPSGKKVTIE